MAPKAALLRRPAARGAAPPARRKPRRSPKSGAKPPRKRKSPVEEPVLAVNEAEEKWKKGEVVTLSSVPLECLELGQLMVVEEGSHMQAKVQAACLITMVEVTPSRSEDPGGPSGHYQRRGASCSYQWGGLHPAPLPTGVRRDGHGGGLDPLSPSPVGEGCDGRARMDFPTSNPVGPQWIGEETS